MAETNPGREMKEEKKEVRFILMENGYEKMK